MFSFKSGKKECESLPSAKYDVTVAVLVDELLVVVSLYLNCSYFTFAGPHLESESDSKNQNELLIN